MICRLVLSLRKASDPSLVRAWNVDHFSTQVAVSQIQSVGSNGVHLSPLRFRGFTTTNLEEETGSESGLMTGRSLADSGWTIDVDVPAGDVGVPSDVNVPEEDKSSRRERGTCRIS
jgi:hypothetical protein